MLSKIDEYRGVIVFFILLTLILVSASYRNKQIDMHSNLNYNYSVNE